MLALTTEGNSMLEPIETVGDLAVAAKVQETQAKLLLTESEAANAFMLAATQGELIAPDTVNVVSIVVGGGVYRDRTIAVHYRLSGVGGRLSHNPRKAEAKKVLLDSLSTDVIKDANLLASSIKKIPGGATALVDISALGIHFSRALQYAGVRVKEVQWGQSPCEPHNQSRYFNLRAQGTVDAVEALKDGRIAIHLDNGYLVAMAEQAVKTPYRLDELSRYRLMLRADQQKEGYPSPDLFDTICMAFLEGV